MSVSPRLAFDVCHEVYRNIRADLEGIPLLDPTKIPSDHLWRSHKAPGGEEFAADFAIACRRALEGPGNARQLMLCNLYYLALTPYEAARRQLGIREDVFEAWSEEVREKVGKLLLVKGLFPPRRYFGERTRARQRPSKRTAQDFAAVSA